jgi:hypothetical protein
VLNVVALVPQLDPRSLNIDRPPQYRPDSYEHALWVNALAVLAHGEFFGETQEQSRILSEKPILQVRAFLNDLIAFKKGVHRDVYLDESAELEGAGRRYHELDIELAHRSMLTLNYLPEDYRSPRMEIWVDRTVELNSLLGNFVCKERFGEFEYIRGPLNYAM